MRWEVKLLDGTNRTMHFRASWLEPVDVQMPPEISVSREISVSKEGSSGKTARGTLDRLLGYLKWGHSRATSEPAAKEEEEEDGLPPYTKGFPKAK